MATDHCMVVVDGEEDAPMKCSISTEGQYWRRRPPQLYVRSPRVPIGEIYPAREESTLITELAVGALQPGLQVEVLKGGVWCEARLFERLPQDPEDDPHANGDVFDVALQKEADSIPGEEGTPNLSYQPYHVAAERVRPFFSKARCDTIRTAKWGSSQDNAEVESSGDGPLIEEVMEVEEEEAAEEASTEGEEEEAPTEEEEEEEDEEEATAKSAEEDDVRLLPPAESDDPPTPPPLPTPSTPRSSSKAKPKAELCHQLLEKDGGQFGCSLPAGHSGPHQLFEQVCGRRPRRGRGGSESAPIDLDDRGSSLEPHKALPPTCQPGFFEAGTRRTGADGLTTWEVRDEFIGPPGPGSGKRVVKWLRVDKVSGERIGMSPAKKSPTPAASRKPQNRPQQHEPSSSSPVAAAQRPRSAPLAPGPSIKSAPPIKSAPAMKSKTRKRRIDSDDDDDDESEDDDFCDVRPPPQKQPPPPERAVPPTKKQPPLSKKAASRAAKPQPPPPSLLPYHAQNETVEVSMLSDFDDGTIKQAEALLMSRFVTGWSDVASADEHRKLIFGLLRPDKVRGSARNWHMPNYAHDRPVSSENAKVLENLALGVVRCGGGGGNSDASSGGGEVVGATCLSLVRKSRREGGYWCCEIILFAVKKDLERQGIGSRLAFQAMAFAEAQQAQWVAVLDGRCGVEGKSWWTRPGAPVNRKTGTTIERLSEAKGRWELPSGFFQPWPMARDHQDTKLENVILLSSPQSRQMSSFCASVSTASEEGGGADGSAGVGGVTEPGSSDIGGVGTTGAAASNDGRGGDVTSPSGRSGKRSMSEGARAAAVQPSKRAASAAKKPSETSGGRAWPSAMEADAAPAAAVALTAAASVVTDAAEKERLVQEVLDGVSDEVRRKLRESGLKVRVSLVPVVENLD